MPAFAARIDAPLLRELAGLVRRGMPAAEITRRVGDSAQARGLPRPSYARVRMLVLEQRALIVDEPTWGKVIEDVWIHHKPLDLLIDKHLGLLANEPRD